MKVELKFFWLIMAFSLILSWANAPLAEQNKLNLTKNNLSNNPDKTDNYNWMLGDLFQDWKLPETVQIHGFASQNYLHTTGNNFFGHSTNMGSFDYTEMGINGSWRPLPQLQTSMQVVYRRAGATDNSYARIDFGFLDYNFLSTATDNLGIRGGRVVNPYGLYNDTRDMPFTRPSILLPQSVYFDRNRNQALSGDGFQIYAEHRSGIGDFILNANGFYSRTEDPSLKTFAYPYYGNFTGKPSWVARLMYEWDEGRIRLGVTTGDLAGKYQPQFGVPDLAPGSFHFRPIVFSAQYSDEKWSFTSEYEVRPLAFSGFSPRRDFDITGEGYYFQGTYRLLDKLEVFARYDVVYWDTSDRNGQRFAAVTGQPAYSRFAKDITTGLRWDITPSIMARAEYHYINGTGWISSLENANAMDTSQHWNLIDLSLSFRF